MWSHHTDPLGATKPVTSKPWYARYGNWLRLLGYSPVLWFLTYFLLSLAVGWPINVWVHAKLANELRMIATPPQAQLLIHRDYDGPTGASVYEEYSTALTTDQLRSHYDAELTGN
jgi:hypothetical protein